MMIIAAGVYGIMAAIYHASTHGEPKITYRAFRAIEVVAPDKWYSDDAVPRYREFGRYTDIYMKTFFDAVRCYFGYILPSRRRRTAAQSNLQMKSLVSSWQDDIKDYQVRAEQEVGNMVKKMKGGI